MIKYVMVSTAFGLSAILTAEKKTYEKVACMVEITDSMYHLYITGLECCCINWKKKG